MALHFASSSAIACAVTAGLVAGAEFLGSLERHDRALVNEEARVWGDREEALASAVRALWSTGLLCVLPGDFLPVCWGHIFCSGFLACFAVSAAAFCHFPGISRSGFGGFQWVFLRGAGAEPQLLSPGLTRAPQLNVSPGAGRSQHLVSVVGVRRVFAGSRPFGRVLLQLFPPGLQQETELIPRAVPHAVLLAPKCYRYRKIKPSKAENRTKASR